MHLSDGILNLPTVAATSVAAGGLVFYGLKGIKEEEIPRVSLMTATFFTFSLISVPVGPSSVHPLLAGLVGIMLGKRSPLAIFIGLLLQAVFFQHGGLTTLGINTIMVAVPALISHRIYISMAKKNRSLYWIGGLVGSLGILICVVILVTVLILTNNTYREGTLSVVNVILLGHLPLALVEGIITAFTVAFIAKVRPHLLKETVPGNS